MFKNFFKSIILLNLMIGGLSTVIIVFFSRYFLEILYGFQNDILTIAVIYAQVSTFQILFNMLIFSLSNQMKVKKQTKNILMIGITGSIFSKL